MFEMQPRNPVEKEIWNLEKDIETIREKIKSLRATLPEEVIQNYTLTDLEGNQVDLEKLFGGHDEMILVHNMGPQCPYCTLWADGFNSLIPYIRSRCALVVETDKPAEKLSKYIQDRGWKFTAVSSLGTRLKDDLGFGKDGMSNPGLSTLFKKDGKIYRHSTAVFGPGDDYSAPWHLFSLLKNGVNKWQPNFNK